MIDSINNDSFTIWIRYRVSGPRDFCLTEYGVYFFIKGTSLNSKPERDDEHLVENNLTENEIELCGEAERILCVQP